MKLQITHRTTYAYAAPVSQSFNEIRLRPLSVDGQDCSVFQLKVQPVAQVRHYFDFYSNFVHIFEVQESHSTLAVESVAEVTTNPNPLAEDAVTVTLDRLEDCARLEQCYDFLQSSTFVYLSPEIWRLAVDATQGQSDVWQTALAIMHFIHDEFRYVPFSTQVHTPIHAVLEQRQGVCQDFAHVMIGMCRSIKIPARYVSGYLYNGAADQLIGAQASHAWCEVYVPQYGWRPLDPTNNQQADDRYVKLAIGRDYHDAAPIKGHYRGTRDNTMEVKVQVRRLDN
jgi:transglutaminase-like putative cysteine protease